MFQRLDGVQHLLDVNPFVGTSFCKGLLSAAAKVELELSKDGGRTGHLDGNGADTLLGLDCCAHDISFKDSFDVNLLCVKIHSK
jgi:hypothetical protein